MFQLVTLLLTFFIVAETFRLSKDVVPEHYRLEIISYLGRKENYFDFEGKVWIRVRVISDQATQNITLHSKDLHIHDHDDGLTVKDISGKTPKYIKTKKIEFQDENDFLTILLEESLIQHHRYEINIEFKGKLGEALIGFYRSSYQDKKSKKKKWLGVTQFQATNARRAFPCFDEPEMKATFDISIGRKAGLTTISNMPLHITEPLEEIEGWYWDRFETTLPMSTYLVAWLVSEYEYKTSPKVDDSNVTFKVWARQDVLNQVDFASEFGPKALVFYENFFNISYPLPKQDLVAIPDFGFNAMENWGLITFRESALLYDPARSTISSQIDTARTIAHELAHQWFGNLVTMNWWNDLWLNEGFATYMAAEAVGFLVPKWKFFEQQIADQMLEVFSFDSLRSSHAVSFTIQNPKEIEQFFDTISYRKGSCLIRMMNLVLGQEVLRTGVSNYLRKNKYGNAEQDDLWYSLTEEAHKMNALPKELNVNRIMNTWTLQIGFPVVTVIRDYKRKSVEVSQKRHLRDIIDIEDYSDPCWWIPLSYSTQFKPDFNQTTPQRWMSCPKHGLTIENLADENEWIIFNNQMAGIYKVNYDNKNWELITKFLQGPDYKTIPVLNRVQILVDAADLGFVGTLNYNVFFNLIKYLKQENEFMPWNAAVQKISEVDMRLETTSANHIYREYMKNLFTPMYEKLGGLEAMKGISQNLNSEKMLELIVRKSCYYDVSNCIVNAKQLFKQFQKNPSGNKIPVQLLTMVYCVALRKGGEEEWNFLWEKFLESDTSSEISSFLSALGCTEETWLLGRYLEWSQNRTLVRLQYRTNVFSAVVTNKVGYSIAKNFLYKNINRILKSMKSDKKRISRYLGVLSDSISDVKDQQEFENFINRNRKHFGEANQAVNRALETVKINMQWKSRHIENIVKYLENEDSIQ